MTESPSEWKREEAVLAKMSSSFRSKAMKLTLPRNLSVETMERYQLFLFQLFAHVDLYDDVRPFRDMMDSSLILSLGEKKHRFINALAAEAAWDVFRDQFFQELKHLISALKKLVRKNHHYSHGNSPLVFFALESYFLICFF